MPRELFPAFSDAIVSFDEQSEKVRACLTELLDTVKEGSVPSQEAVHWMNMHLVDLREKYSTAYQLLQDSVEADELPEHGVSVRELAEAMEHSQVRHLQEQLARAKEILHQFIRVKSLIDGYAKALEPYQSTASALLSQLQQDTVEVLMPQTEAPALFLETMALDTLHTPAGIQQMKKVQEHYPDVEIIMGLMERGYFVDTQEQEALSSAEAEEETEELLSSGSTDENLDVPVPEEAISETREQGPEEKETDPSQEEERKMLPVRNRVKSGTPSASAFRKDLYKLAGNYPEVREILPIFSNLGILSKRQVYRMGVCLDCFSGSKSVADHVSAAIDMLTQKGYLARFIDEQGVELHCLSSYCYSCMCKESIRTDRRLFSVSVGHVKQMAETEVDAEDAFRFYLCNNLLINYLQVQKNTLSTENYETIKKQIEWLQDHYQIGFYEEGTLQTAYLGLVDHHDGKFDARGIHAKYIVLPKLAIGDDSNSVIINADCEKILLVDQREIHVLDLPEAKYPEKLRKSEEIAPLNQDAEENVSVETNEVLGDETEPFIETAPEEKVRLSGEEEETQVGDESDEEERDGREDAFTPEGLLKLERTPTDDEFCAVIHGILSKEVPEETLKTTVVNAVLLARGAGLVKNRPNSEQLSVQLRLATMLLLDECIYSSEFLSTTFSAAEEDTPAMTLAAYLYAMLTPSVMYDYALIAQTKQQLSNFEAYFPGLFSFKALFNKMLSVREVKASGFTPAVIALLGNERESERFIQSLSREASNDLVVNAPYTRVKALPILYTSEFGIGSDLYTCMQMITEKNTTDDSLELIEMVLGEYCDMEEGKFYLQDEKIQEHLDKKWDKLNAKSTFRLEYGARDQVLRQYRHRLNIMRKWVEHIRSREDSKEEIERLRTLRDEILQLLDKIQCDLSWRQVKDANVLAWLLVHMRDYLTDAISDLDTYSDLLYTGLFSLSEEGVPQIDVSPEQIKYYEVWRNALYHIVTPRKTSDEIAAEILGETGDDNDLSLKDNLRQLSLLGAATSSSDDRFVVTEEQKQEAKISANIYTENFQNDLELAYAYNQINEREKENLAGIVHQYQDSFYEIGDFASWRRFLHALRRQMEELTEKRKQELREHLSEKLSVDSTSSLLQEAERLLEEDSNFAVTEEYLNRYEAGERKLDNITLSDHNYFQEFLAPSVQEDLYQECIRRKEFSLKKFAWDCLEKRLPKDWTKRLREDSKKLILNWPSRKDFASPDQVQGLLKGLGITVIGAAKDNSRKEEVWRLSVKPEERSRVDYLHPIAAFGTQMKSPLHVIFLYGSYTNQQLVDTITSMDLGAMSIVFIDRPIEIGNRRQIGEIFHQQKTGQNSFLLIDQVLFLYLAMHQETERLPALLQCTLPFATYQPFVRDGGSTADEMFCGRTRELATIIDPNGACVVYGGRQLGKTALLERAESRCSKPENKAYAVYSTIIRQKKESEVVETLLRDIERKTDGKIVLKHCRTIRGMCDQLSDLFRNKSIVSMHLLIDEVDDFLGAIADEAYRPLQPLVDLRRETKNDFKFVIAGLHNVCRAKNATRDNGIFGQLGTPLSIKPLSPSDALQLLSKPLRYLGFQIDRYPYLETILTNTNYYPGILQFFGYILVETLNGQYGKYYHAADGNPPFTLQDEQLGAVMNSADLNKSIKDKFRWSLELDPRYFMIARCITILYYMHEKDRTSGSWRGFSIKEVMEVAEAFESRCWADLSDAEYTNLMDEMVEMGILGKADETSHLYRLRRNSFVDIIGESSDVLEAEIKQNNVED